MVNTRTRSRNVQLGSRVPAGQFQRETNPEIRRLAEFR
jgi:hypothetical protein